LLVVLLLSAACVSGPTAAPQEPALTPTSSVTGPSAPAGATPPPLPPQGTTLRFDQVSVEDGLSQNSGKCILQDRKGFLWVGTEDGLNKFDGHGFTVYRHDPDDANSLSNNLITAVYQDSAGILWIGTYGGGLNRLDPETEQFTHFRHDPDKANSLSEDQIQEVVGDRNGVLWIGTRGGGLNRFDPQTGQWRHYRNDPDNAQSLSYDVVNALLEDSVGNLWVGTSAGLDRLDHRNSSDPDAARFTRYQYDPGDAASLSSNGVTSLYEDRLGNLWVGTVGGLNRLDLDSAPDPDAATFVRYQHDPEDGQSLSNNGVVSIIQDRRGVLWVGTNDGLNRFDPEMGRFARYLHDATDPHSLRVDDVDSLAVDQAGGLWVGTSGGGLSRYDGHRDQFTHYRANPNVVNGLSENSIWGIYEDAAGELWIGTAGGGLNRLNRETGQWRHYRNDPNDPLSLSNDTVVAVHEDRSGALWLGTWGGGLNRFDRETETFTRYQFDPHDPHSLSNNVVWFVYEDQKGTLWVGTAYGLNRLDGASSADPDEVHFTRYLNDPDDAQSLSDNDVGSVLEDRDGVLWFGTHSGLNRLGAEDRSDPDAVQFTHYQHDPNDPQSLSHNIVFVIHEDRASTLWVGTWGGGLNRFDRASGTFTHYRVKDGLPNDVVYGILEEAAPPDGGGGLWLSTNYGLSRFDPQTETFRNYEAADGLQSNEFDFGSYFKSDSGEMFFGGINGFNAFFPDQVQDYGYVPPVVLTSITQGGEAVDLGKVADAITEVTFAWPDNDFEFEFAALSYYQTHKNQHAYMLEGYDDDWHQVGTRRFGGYTNLPGGAYTLRLKASNGRGLWDEAGISLPVTIVPPFWATWWFRAIAALVFLASAYGAFRLRVRRIEARSRELEEQVTSRTTELAALNAIAGVVSRSLDLQQVLGDALDTTLEVTEQEAGGIYLLQAGTRSSEEPVLVVAAHKGLSAEMVDGIDNLVVGEGFSGRVVESCEPMKVRDLPSDPRLTRSVVRDSGFRSVAIAPLVARAEVLGTLFVMTRDEAELTSRDVELLMAIGGQIGVAIENARLFEAQQRRAEQFQVIHEVDQHIASILDVDQLVQEIVLDIRDSFGYYEVGIGLIEGDELVIKASSGIRWQDLEGPPLRIKVGAEGVMGWVADTGQPMLVPDVSKEPRYLVWPHTARTRSELAVPLKSKAGVIGVLNIESNELEAFHQEDITVLQSLASRAAIAIENARYFEAEQRRAEQFRVITEVARRITLTLDQQEMLSEMARLIRKAFGYYHVGIGLIEGDELVYRVGAGELWDDPAFAFKPARLKLGKEGISGRVAASGEPLLIPDVSQDPRYVWMEGSQTRSELVVPILVKGQVIGVLDAQSDRVSAFDNADLAVLQSLAHQAGAAIENARLYAQAQQAAVMEERQRLARDLHDAVTQTLFSASLIAEAVPASWEIDRQEGRQLLLEVQRLVRGAMAEMRTLLLELRPAALMESDLGDLMRQLSEAASGREGLPVQVTLEGLCVLPPDVHVTMYRIAQEALNNVGKHARASRIEVALRCAPTPSAWRAERDPLGSGARVELRVNDNGRGFDPSEIPSDRLGLGIMRERAEAIGARLTIDSRPGRGTQITVVWEGTDG
jgi:GAF domain-containing protein/ligand-binding sensor domain-containing protein